MNEFDFINKLLRPLAGRDSAGLQDDCAHFDGYVITKDILVAGVHFFADDAPFDLARKCLRVNLSDLASCGAEPFGFMMAAALPKGISEEWLTEFTRGLRSDIAEYNFQLLGGDTTSHDGALTISVTAIGRALSPITRAGAKEGDNIFVSGKIGEGLAGLKTRSGKYILPEPRIALGLELRGKANACIDISDGLLADLGHICSASKLGAEINSVDIPTPVNCHPELVSGSLRKDPDLRQDDVTFMDYITAGDDYELCFTSALNEIPGCHKIGKMVAGSGIKLDGKITEAKGYQHKI